MTTRTDPFLNHLRIARELLAEPPPSLTPERVQLLHRFVINDLNGAVTLLSMMHAHLVEIREMQSVMFPETNEPGPTSIDPESTRARAGSRYFQLVEELGVLIRAVYEWLYHVKEDIEAIPTVSAHLPRSVRDQLDRYCLFRNVLITHKKGLQVYTSGGMRISASGMEAELLLVPLTGFPEAARNSLSRLFKDATSCLTAEQGKEVNVFEQIGILSRNLEAFPGDIKKRTSDFIRQYGAISDYPVNLATFVRQLAEVIMQEPSGTTQDA